MNFDNMKYLEVIKDIEEVLTNILLQVLYNNDEDVEVILVPIDKAITLMKIRSLDKLKKYDIYIEYELSFTVYLIVKLDRYGNIKINKK